MDTTTVIVVTVAIVILLVLAALSMLISRQQRTKRLRDRFGPEYDRALIDAGDRRKAEDMLEKRVDHVKKLNIRALSADETDRFTHRWKMIQAEFVDAPLAAIQNANQLIKEAMLARGYPVEDFEQRAADISVHHPELVDEYRGLRMIAVTGGGDGELTTEDLRQAMVHVRALFEELVGTPNDSVDTHEKERT
jgi:hypothetical protein